MSTVWPSTVPLTLPLGSGIYPQQQTVITEMDAGPPQVRRRFTARTERIEPVMLWTGDQLATFETWFSSTIAGGASRFKVVHPRTNVEVDAIFTAAPEMTPVAGGLRSEQVWSVKLPLLLLP